MVLFYLLITLLSLFGYRGNQFHPAVMIGLQHKNILCHSEFFGVGKITGYPHSIYNHSKQPQSIRIMLLYLLFINGFYRVDQPFGQRKVFCNDFGFPLHILFERQRPAVIGHQRIGQCHSPDIGRVGDS